MQRCGLVPVGVLGALPGFLVRPVSSLIVRYIKVLHFIQNLLIQLLQLRGVSTDYLIVINASPCHQVRLYHQIHQEVVSLETA